MTKFVASLSVINEDVDMDVELVRDMLGSEKGALEIYETAAEVDGEIFIVDADLAIAELVAAKLNDAYAEFLEAEAARAKGAAVQAAKELIGTAYEGDSRVPVAMSAEDQALANLEKKSTKNQTKNEKVETTMTNTTNQTQEQINANSAAARAFLNSVGAKTQAANKGPAKKEENKPAESTKPVVKVQTKTEEKEVVNVKNRKGSVKPTIKLNTEEETNMNQTTETTENTGRKSSGRKSSGRSTTVVIDTAKVVETNNRIEFDDEPAGTVSKPWCTDAERYTALASLEELIAFRQLEEYGITDIQFRNPQKALSYMKNIKKEIISVIDVHHVVDGKKRVTQFRVEKQTWKGSKSDIKSNNIGWAQDESGNLAPFYQKWVRNEDQDVIATCTCGEKVQMPLNSEATCKCGADIECEVNENNEVEVFTVEVDKKKLRRGETDAITTTELECYIPNAISVADEDVTVDIIALAMGFAQYAHGFNMHGLVDAE